MPRGWPRNWPKCPRPRGRITPTIFRAIRRCASSAWTVPTTMRSTVPCCPRRTWRVRPTCASSSPASVSCGAVRACSNWRREPACRGTPTSITTGLPACACTCPSSRTRRCGFIAAMSTSTWPPARRGCSTIGGCTGSRTQSTPSAYTWSPIRRGARHSGVSWPRAIHRRRRSKRCATIPPAIRSC